MKSKRPSFRPPVGRKPSTTTRLFTSNQDRREWYPDNWEELSAEVRRESGYRCMSHKLFGGKPCGVYAPPPLQSMLHVHHVIPLPKGSNKKSNLICLCMACHKRAHNDKKGMNVSKKQEALLKQLGKK